MPFYGYKPKSNILRDIESAVPGVKGVFSIEDGSLRVDFDAGLDDYQKSNLDELMVSLGFEPMDEHSERLLESVAKGSTQKGLSFAELQKIKLLSIDLRTEAMIQAGFEYNGKQLSLSIAAQIKWGNAYQARAILTAFGAYPLGVNTKDDLDIYFVQDEAELETIYTKIVGVVLTILGTDAALKDRVRAATTPDELDAIVDDR